MNSLSTNTPKSRQPHKTVKTCRLNTKPNTFSTVINKVGKTDHPIRNFCCYFNRKIASQRSKFAAVIYKYPLCHLKCNSAQKSQKVHKSR